MCVAVSHQAHGTLLLSNTDAQATGVTEQGQDNDRLLPNNFMEPLQTLTPPQR